MSSIDLSKISEVNFFNTAFPDLSNISIEAQKNLISVLACKILLQEADI